jgi:hypothetical protein
VVGIYKVLLVYTLFVEKCNLVSGWPVRARQLYNKTSRNPGDQLCDLEGAQERVQLTREPVITKRTVGDK